MPAEQATILIPDISGYTEFVSRTEIDHSSHILNHLLETIVESVSEDFVVSEIEGDAVLMYRKGDPAPKRTLVAQCTKIFAAFHREISGMKAQSICQCGACQGVGGLSLKFVVHFGAISEIRVARFVKASGLDMVIAHRLLKNSIGRHEYVLMSRGYLDQVADRDEGLDLQWQSAQEEYPSIGVVRFDYAELGGIKNDLPVAAVPQQNVEIDGSAGIGVDIDAGFRQVLAVVTDLGRRLDYVPGVRRVEQEAALPAVGGKHTCVFDDFQVEVEPIRVQIDDSCAEYFEFARVAAMSINVVVHYSVLDRGANRCRCDVHIYPEPGHALPEPTHAFLMQSFEANLNGLKRLVEAVPEPA